MSAGHTTIKRLLQENYDIILGVYFGRRLYVSYRRAIAPEA